MNWDLIKELLKLHPAKLNIALLLLGVMGMIFISNRKDEKLDLLEKRLEQKDRAHLYREDSLNRVHQNQLAMCAQEINKSRDAFIESLNKTSEKLERRLDERSEEDRRRFKAANISARIIKENNRKVNKIINGTKSITPLED